MKIADQVAGPPVSSLQRASVAMEALLGSPIDELHSVRAATTAFLGAGDVSTATSRISGLTTVLAALERRHNELKEPAIRGIQL